MALGAAQIDLRIQSARRDMGDEGPDPAGASVWHGRCDRREWAHLRMWRQRERAYFLNLSNHRYSEIERIRADLAHALSQR